jgi:GT2 family glycosyltransferase
MKSVSIIIPLWNRTALLKNTLDSIYRQANLPEKLQVIVVEDRPVNNTGRSLCVSRGVEYYCRRRPGSEYNNVGAVYNCGIKIATGDILIMQSAEVKYETSTGISDLVAAIQDDELSSVVPIVKSLTEEGGFAEWFCHPREGARPGWAGFFVHVMHRSQILKIGGYDEIFQGYGFDDDLLLFRMKKNGIRTQFVESVLASHQWHPRHEGITQETEANRQIFVAKQEAVSSGREPNIANIGRDWGVL